MIYNFLIQNGMVYEPSTHTLEQRDVAIVCGKMAQPKTDGNYRQIIDASGCIVTPGLLDYHVHFHGVEAGVCPDANAFCNGITTAVDAGSTGASNYPLFYRTEVMNSQVRLLSDLYVASGGQVTWRYEESLDPATYDEPAIQELFRLYPHNLVGLKVRLSRSIIADEQAPACIERMLSIAEKVGTRIVVHVTDCAMPLDRLAAMLRPGDVICHIYQNRGIPARTCLDTEGKVLTGLQQARARGVLFDSCHGVGNFDLEICRQAVAQGFVPDIISSDNNSNGSFMQPLHSLPRILSKYLDFGMALEDVLDCVTRTPAELVGMPELGTLAEGTAADVAIFKLKEKPVLHTDINGHSFIGNQILVPQMTFKDGHAVYCQADFA